MLDRHLKPGTCKALGIQIDGRSANADLGCTYFAAALTELTLKASSLPY